MTTTDKRSASAAAAGLFVLRCGGSAAREQRCSGLLCGGRSRARNAAAAAVKSARAETGLFSDTGESGSFKASN